MQYVCKNKASYLESPMFAFFTQSSGLGPGNIEGRRATETSFT